MTDQLATKQRAKARAKKRAKRNAEQRAKNEAWLRSECARLEAETERLREMQRRGLL